ncbi:MAG: helix-turn-helix domain-containing protein [Luteolibacter sp.]
MKRRAFHPLSAPSAVRVIRALRERHGLSRDQLSDLLGCGKKSLSRWVTMDATS